MRRSILFWTVLCAAVVVGLFVVKHRVQALEENLRGLNARIISDQNAIQVLQAEWSYLNQPARLETLSRKLLDMQAPQPGQIVPMQQFLRAHEQVPAPMPKEAPDRRTHAAPHENAPHEAEPVPEPKRRIVPSPGGTRVADRRPEPRPQPPASPAPSADDDWLKPILAKLKRPQ